jgi:ribonuclease E
MRPEEEEFGRYESVSEGSSVGEFGPAEAAEFAVETEAEESLHEAIAPPALTHPAVPDQAEPEPAAEPIAEVEPEPVAEAPPVVVPPLVALPETLPEEEPGQKRRRSRGPATPRKRKGAEPAADAAADEKKGRDDTERPPVMGSAERRTTGKDSGPNAAHEIDPGPGGPSGEDDDDLLFFPRTPAPAKAPPPPPPPEPEPEPEYVAPPRPEAPTVRTPPPRPRPPMSRGSIEDDLAADLDALDIGGEPNERGPRPTPPPPPPAPRPSRREEPVAEFEPDEREPRSEGPGEFEREEDEGSERRGGFEPEFDEVGARPRGSREGSRGRDDRRGPRDGNRGGRDDRRGPPRRMGGRPPLGRPKPLIQDIFKRGQEVLVQVIKEGIGTKGPTLSTYISIPGRYLVVMPHLNRVGVSRKIEDDEQRRRLREFFNELKPPRGLGFIMRTAAIDKNKKELQRDLAYLSRIWQVIVRRIKNLKSPAEIYQESDMITRTIRDTFTSDIDTIIVDEPAAYEHAREFLEIVMPRFADRLKFFDGKEPLFHRYGIEDEIARIQMRKIPLQYGGSIVIEQTEALVAIDVNSGNFRADNNAEETAFQMNLQAAKEIARQLRLRDLGGVIVNDFIDMRDEKHRRIVEKAMRDAVQRDRARTKILKISAFGLIEMTRQRIRPSLKRSVYQDCPYCHGMAQVKTCESMSLEVIRMLQLAANRPNVQRIEVHVAEEVGNYLLNKKRREIAKLEDANSIVVQVTGHAGKPPELLDFLCFDSNNNEVKVLPHHEEPVRHHHHHHQQRR